jgi:hypothetical protein
MTVVQGPSAARIGAKAFRWLWLDLAQSGRVSARNESTPFSQTIDGTSPGMLVACHTTSSSRQHAFHAQTLRSPRRSVPRRGGRHAVRPDGRRQHALVYRFFQTAGCAYRPRQARARDRGCGDRLQRRDRQGCRCLRHLRPWRDPADDGAAGRGSRPPAGGGVCRRGADQCQVLQPVYRPGAAGDRDRGALHGRAQRAAHDGRRARNLPYRHLRATPGRAGHSLRFAESRARGQPALRDLDDVPAQGRAHAA